MPARLKINEPQTILLFSMKMNDFSISPENGTRHA
jgi:hypothetical protein